MMSTNCVRCIKNKRTKGLYCDDCAELANLENACNSLAEAVQGALDSIGANYGFTLMLFHFGEGGHLTYISNAQREDMILAIKEFLVKQGEQEV
jgi:hypothetical protein